MSGTHHTVDPKFTYRDKRSGKDVVLYQGLLDAAHRAGLVAIETEILAYPCDENYQTCIIRATVVLDRDPDRPLRFTAIGDANPKNVGANIAPHFIRMAETRAKARALRDALNVGMVTLEELGGDYEADDPQPATPAPQRHDTSPLATRDPATLLSTIKDPTAMTQTRKRALHAYYGAADTLAGLNDLAISTRGSGLPEADLTTAFRWHHNRISQEVSA